MNLGGDAMVVTNTGILVNVVNGNTCYVCVVVWWQYEFGGGGVNTS